MYGMYKHYTIENGVFNKKIYYNEKINSDYVELEAELQEISSNYGFSPKIINTIYEDDSATIQMEFIDEHCLYYKYGNGTEDIPKFIWKQMRKKLNILYMEEGIQYVDITPYNFIEKNGEVYIIDFGHAGYIYEDEYPDPFLIEFLNGENKWNSDYL